MIIQNVDPLQFLTWLRYHGRALLPLVGCDGAKGAWLCALRCLQGFQRLVHEGLPQLELINKQYRRLARENRTDSSCRLRGMANSANQRWDDLQRRGAVIVRRLKVRPACR